MSNNDNDFDQGEEVSLGFGNKLTFYPLTWMQQRQLRKEWAAVFGKDGAQFGTDAWYDAAAVIFLASVQRGAPEATLDTVMNAIDTRNMTACFKALGIASGFKKKEAAVEAPVEEKAHQSRPSSPLNGAASTPA